MSKSKEPNAKQNPKTKLQIVNELNPKSEYRNPKQARNIKTETRRNNQDTMTKKMTKYQTEIKKSYSPSHVPLP